VTIDSSREHLTSVDREFRRKSRCEFRCECSECWRSRGFRLCSLIMLTPASSWITVIYMF